MDLCRPSKDYIDDEANIFQKTSNILESSILIGYDNETDRYEISASGDKTFHIKNVDKYLEADITATSEMDCNSRKSDIIDLAAL